MLWIHLPARRPRVWRGEGERSGSVCYRHPSPSLARLLSAHLSLGTSPTIPQRRRSANAGFYKRCSARQQGVPPLRLMSTQMQVDSSGINNLISLSLFSLLSSPGPFFVFLRLWRLIKDTASWNVCFLPPSLSSLRKRESNCQSPSLTCTTYQGGILAGICWVQTFAGFLMNECVRNYEHHQELTGENDVKSLMMEAKITVNLIRDQCKGWDVTPALASSNNPPTKWKHEQRGCKLQGAQYLWLHPQATRVRSM